MSEGEGVERGTALWEAVRDLCRAAGTGSLRLWVRETPDSTWALKRVNGTLRGWDSLLDPLEVLWAYPQSTEGEALLKTRGMPSLTRPTHRGSTGAPQGLHRAGACSRD